MRCSVVKYAEIDQIFVLEKNKKRSCTVYIKIKPAWKKIKRYTSQDIEYREQDNWIYRNEIHAIYRMNISCKFCFKNFCTHCIQKQFLHSILILLSRNRQRITDVISIVTITIAPTTTAISTTTTVAHRGSDNSESDVSNCRCYRCGILEAEPHEIHIIRRSLLQATEQYRDSSRSHQQYGYVCKYWPMNS